MVISPEGHSKRNTMSSSSLPTQHEKEIIDKFRAAVADILTPEKDNDAYLRKWLIARKFNIEKAEEMLRKHVWYMKVNELDKITLDYPLPESVKYFYTTLLGYDNEGSTVRLLKLGATDMKALTIAMSNSEAVKYATYILVHDNHMRNTERGESACEKQVLLLDLQGLAWRSIVHRLVVERTVMLLRVYEANHPENLKVAYILNAPSFFNFVYNWLKTILPETIISKIQVLSPEETPEVLGKNIDLSIVPASMGGRRRDPDGDPVCPSLFDLPPGTPIPEGLFKTDQLQALLNDPEAKRAVIESRSSFRIEKVITLPGSVLQWDVQTTKNDIRTGLGFKTDKNSEIEMIIPIHRVDSHRIPESRRFVCQKGGIYELIFDNSFSWLTKKELIYKVNVTLPSDTQISVLQK